MMLSLKTADRVAVRLGFLANLASAPISPEPAPGLVS